MKLTKEYLEELYTTMSLAQVAERLGMARSTLYYYMRKLGVRRRDKSEAQRQYLKQADHQRKGKKHSLDTKEKISEGTRHFWDSDAGQIQKVRLADLRRNEWNKRSMQDRKSVLNRLQSADRPSPGELSRFGMKLAAFLSDREEVNTGIMLTAGHVSDIILPSHKVVIELLLPIAVYGEQEKAKLSIRYKRLIDALNDAGYRVMIIEDISNSISYARCQRVYDKLLKFFKDTKIQTITIES